MRIRFAILGFLALSLAYSGLASSDEIHLPPETHNAALRYWLAFAEIQDPPVDEEIADLLEKTAAGDAAWDEAKLGPILDANESAVQTMHRATRLPECDWGLEYNRGAAASVAYVPRARVLARLNTLYGMRLAAKGELHEAVETWLVGIRFSQDLAKGGTLFFALVAKTALLSNLDALAHAAESGNLSATDKAKIAVTVQALPETGFDWSQALVFEQSAIEIAIRDASSKPDSKEYLRQLIGQPLQADVSTLSPLAVAAFEKYMSAGEHAMRLPPAETDAHMERLQPTYKSLNPIFRQMTPSFSKVNDSRKQIALSRQTLLHVVNAR